MKKIERIQAALAKAKKNLKAYPGNAKYAANVATYEKALENIKKYGRPEGPKKPPTPKDANVNQ